MEKLKTISKLPLELVNALASSDKARHFFDTLAPSHRKAYIEWVGEAQNNSARKERAGKAILMMEANKKSLTLPN